jgi:uncharacterized oxidoreductase
VKNTNVKVFELAPPGTETPLFRGDFDETDLGGARGMDVAKLARLAIRALEKDVLEIRPGVSNILKLQYARKVLRSFAREDASGGKGVKGERVTG